MDADACKLELLALLPPGRAWVAEPGSRMDLLMEGMAQSLAALDARVEDLLSEADPRSALQLLPSWERVFGIKTDGTLALQARRDQVTARVAQMPGQSRADYIAYAAALGFGISIDEYPATPDRFTWRVNVAGEAPPALTCAGGCDEPIYSAVPSVGLEAAFNALKPAHTTVLFNYGS